MLPLTTNKVEVLDDQGHRVDSQVRMLRGGVCGRGFVVTALFSYAQVTAVSAAVSRVRGKRGVAGYEVFFKVHYFLSPYNYLLFPHSFIPCLPPSLPPSLPPLLPPSLHNPAGHTASSGLSNLLCARRQDQFLFQCCLFRAETLEAPSASRGHCHREQCKSVQ